MIKVNLLRFRGDGSKIFSGREQGVRARNELRLNVLDDGEEEIKLIVMLANQFRMILQVKLMVKNGYKERDMATIIKEHPYRVKLAMQSNFKINELENYLIKLEELDYSIKSGKLDKSFGFEMFLLNI